MNGKKFFLVQMILVLVFFSSCEKKSINDTNNALFPDSEIILKNGALNFQTVDAFFEMDAKLGAMTDQERKAWENRMGFVSMNTELSNVFEQIDAAEDEVAIEQIVSSNSDIVEFINGEVCPIIKSSSYAAVANRKGVFFVNGVIHKVEGGKIASSEDGSEQTVIKALKSDLQSISKGVNVFQYISDSPLKGGGCGTRKSAYYNTSKRKCDFEMKTYKYYCMGCCDNYYYQVKVESKITNYKKNWFGHWMKYNTSCSMEDQECTISAPKVVGYNGQHSIFYYQDVTRVFADQKSNYDCSTMTRWTYVGDRVQNVGIKTPKFSRVKGRASNRGIGNNWAEIDCGVW